MGSATLHCLQAGHGENGKGNGEGQARAWTLSIAQAEAAAKCFVHPIRDASNLESLAQYWLKGI